MGDDFKKVAPGEPLQIAASTFNAMLDATAFFRAQQASGGAKDLVALSSDTIPVKNQSGSDRERFEVLGISDPLITPTENLDEFQNRSPLTGVVPAISEHVGRFAVLLEPAVDGAVAKARLTGIVPVRLKVIFDWHQFAHIENGESSRLVSDCVGYPILWKDDEENEDEQGNRWALVKIGGPAPALGVWRNSGPIVGPHEHFRITGADTANPLAITGTRPTDQFGPDYAVNGSQTIDSGQYGVYQRTDEVFVAYGGPSPEPGDQLGPAPGSGSVAKSCPPVCRVLGIVDAAHGIARAALYRPAQRFRLLEPLYECGTADAQIMGRSGYNYTALTAYASDTISDTLGAVAQSPLAMRDS